MSPLHIALKPEHHEVRQPRAADSCDARLVLAANRSNIAFNFPLRHTSPEGMTGSRLRSWHIELIKSVMSEDLVGLPSQKTPRQN